MSRTILYYFTINSPWTYFGHRLFHEIAARHGARIVYKPVPLLEVFEATGSLPLPKRPPARQRYRWMELQRWRDKRALPLNPKPAHFPLDATLVNRAIVAVVETGADPAGLIGAALSGVWAEDRDLNDEATIREILASSGFDPDAIPAAARSEAVAAIYERNGKDAIAADVFGAPAYVLEGEVFWGQDRLELLDDALGSGRRPYRPL
jgi:2-hydroxychromene-2-carboxylate isomerase